MIRRTLAFLILAPLALVIIALALANRQTVAVSFDPFNAAKPAFIAHLPLFLLVFILVILGVLIGGIAAWLRQSRWRRHARRLESRLHRALGELEVHKRRAETAAGSGTTPGAASQGQGPEPERRNELPPPQWPPPRALPPAAA